MKYRQEYSSTKELKLLMSELQKMLISHHSHTENLVNLIAEIQRIIKHKEKVNLQFNSN